MIIFVNLFAPFSVGVGNKKILEIKTSRTEAVSNSLAEERAVKAATEARDLIIRNGGTKEEAQAEYTRVHDQVYKKEYSGKTDAENLETFKQAVVDATKRLEEAKASGSQTRIDAAELSLRVATKNLDDFQTSGLDQKLYDSEGKIVGDTGETMNMPACGVFKGSLMGCVAQGFYYIFFVPTSYLFALAGTFFDYTFSYSVQDTSYRSSFVVEGWGLVRDFCNMFFIFIMLYVAFGTILSLHSMKTKETIINVVIIGLFINFSLFATQLIIDASNVTARVFYNSDSIKITEKSPTGATEVVSKISTNGAIPLSAALVNKVNPQSIIINAREINKIPNRSNAGLNNVSTSSDTGLGVGQFILIVILASAINIVGLVAFLTVGMLFIARVIGLWLAMILSPVAFFTYILPEMSGTKMIGWKNWWPETLKLAFLAPVFIFFMYIILKFLQLDLISDAAGKSGIDFLIATIIPFIFVMILLLKAKKIATDMSGEFGEMAVKAGSAVSGLALGAATGGAALVGRATLGRMGANLADSEKWKEREAKGGAMGFLAKNVRNIGSFAGKASFDARNTKLGASAGKNLGVDMGKGKEGGFAKARVDQKIKAEKRAKELEVGEYSEEMKAKREAEAKQKKVENIIAPVIDAAKADVESTKQAYVDANTEWNKNKDKADTDPEKIKAKEKVDEATREYEKAKQTLKGLNTGGAITEKDHHGNVVEQKNEDGTIKYATHNGSISEAEYKKIAEGVTEKEKTLVAAAKSSEGAKEAAKNQKEATLKANEEAMRAANEQAAAQAKTLQENAQQQANTVLAQAQKAELEAIAAFSAASANHAKNPTTENKIMMDRAEAMKNSAMANTEKAKTTGEQMVADATVAADKLKKDAEQKAKEEKKKADDQAVKDEEKFVEDAKKAKTEAEQDLEASRAKMAEAEKSKNRAGGFGTTLKDAKHETHEKQVIIDNKNNARKEDIAKDLQSNGSKIFNMIVTGGVYSREAADISAHNIRMGTKTEPMPSSGGHGGGGHDSHAAGGHDTHAKPAGGGGHDTHAKPAGGHDTHAKPAH